MEPADGAPSYQLRTGRMNEEAPSESASACTHKGISKEDEDFLSGLNPEEKDCLLYVLRIINALDEDSDDTDGHQEGMEESLGSEGQSRSNVVDSRSQRRTSLEASPAGPDPCPAAPKVVPLSGDTIPRSELDPSCDHAKGPPRLPGSHPAHFRKFNTIVRSGVNVQELRSRFLLQCDSSAAVREPREGSGAAINQLGPFAGCQKSRGEALQKRSFHQRNSSLPNTNSCLLPVAGQCVQTSLPESVSHGATANSINPTEQP